MAIDLSRRSLLFGRKPAPVINAAFYPPWAGTDFTDDCTRCGACVTACPTRIIVPGDGGFPEVDFTGGECTFCGACREACTPKALSATEPWHIQARIGSACIAQKGTDCRVCGERCATGAIRFQLQIGKVAQPLLDGDLCNGCGDCIASCPGSAIRMNHPETD